MATYCPYCMHSIVLGQRCPNCGSDPTSYHPSAHHVPMGYLLQNRYLVGKVLGEGGFGITYLGLDTTLERRVAIKEYFPNVLVHRETSVTLDVTCYEGEKRTLYEKGRDQFLQEARVMAKFSDLKEIVQVLDYFPLNNTAYIVMEFLEGNTLHDLLKQQGRIPAKYLFEIMEPLLSTMNVMHSRGMIHRDISPDNIMLLDNGQVKLLDFGCARDAGAEHTMTVMLKHGYAPMEQYTGYNQGPWTDIYALCATFYRCLTGQAPPRVLERMSGRDPLIPPNRLGAALTPEQESALMRGLEVEPKKRWQSMAGLYAALYDTVIKDFPHEADVDGTEILVEDKAAEAPPSGAAPNTSFCRAEKTPSSSNPIRSVFQKVLSGRKPFLALGSAGLLLTIVLVVGTLFAGNQGDHTGGGSLSVPTQRRMVSDASVMLSEAEISGGITSLTVREESKSEKFHIYKAICEAVVSTGSQSKTYEIYLVYEEKNNTWTLTDQSRIN